jgi:cardiolipin synthase A/B
MGSLWTILFTGLGIYALITGLFLITENRRPESTFAWLLAFIFLPGIGLLIYLFFGRSHKAFSKRQTLWKQNLEPAAVRLLRPALERQDAAIQKLEGKTASHRKLMLLVRRNSHSVLTTHNQVQIQQNASEFYPSLLEDMKEARHSIHHQYFIWRSDEFTEKLNDILVAKAKDGVAVRILYDPLGSQNMKRKYRKQLLAAGISIVPTSPIYQLHTLSYRNHRKITVIDDAISYTGGMNIGQEHIDGGKGFTSWRDTQVRFVGETSAILQAVFMVDWYNAIGENLFAEEYFPLAALEGFEGDVPVQILTSGPDSRWAAIRQLYANMITTAEDHVYLQSPYFILDTSIAEALRSAAMSGIDVKVMISARPSGDPWPDWAGNTYFGDVIDAGVRIFLYEKGYLHAKTISIDSKICSIGSANIDIRSFSINYELNSVLYDERLARELEDDFARDLENCSEFREAEYQRRNVAVRFRDSVARLISPLL